MEQKEFNKRYIEPYEGLDYYFEPGVGFIVWRPATGLNIELLHLITFDKGYSSELQDRLRMVGKMVKRLEKRPPYYSIFGFCIAGKPYRREFYNALGFKVLRLEEAPYKEDAFMVYADYESLKKKYLKLS